MKCRDFNFQLVSRLVTIPHSLQFNLPLGLILSAFEVKVSTPSFISAVILCS